MEIKLLLSLTSIVHCLPSGAAASFYQGESLRLWADLPDEYRKFEDGLDPEVELTDFLPLPTEVEREEFAQKVFRVEDFVPHDGESGTSKLWQNVLRRVDELPASRRVNISLEALVRVEVIGLFIKLISLRLSPHATKHEYYLLVRLIHLMLFNVCRYFYKFILE